MNKLFIWEKTGVRIRTAGVLAAALIFAAGAQIVWAAPTSGAAVSDNIVVREEAVDGAQIGSLYADQEVTITGESEASDGNVWYQIIFEGNEGEQTGWVRSDLIDASETSSADTEDGDEADSTGAQDTASQPGEGDTEETVVVRVEMADGYVDLTNVPEDVAATVSDRFIPAVCEMEDGSVQGYQLAAPDDLVTEDADLTIFYYLYGSDEQGEQGWYVYDAEENVLQKSILNMQYSIPAEPVQAEPQNSGDSSLGRMISGGLCLICLLLLVLVIVFSVRYRKLRDLLEEGTREVSVPEKTEVSESVKEEKETRKRSGHQKKAENRKAVHAVRLEEEAGYDLADDDSYDVYDLDELDRVLEAEREAEELKKSEPEKTLEEADLQEEELVLSREDAELERILKEESEKMFRLKPDETGKTVSGDTQDRKNGKKTPADQKKTDAEQKRGKDEIPDLPEDIEFVDDGVEDEDLEFL